MNTTTKLTLGAKRALEMTESQTLAMAQYVRELKARGEVIHAMTLGEPDFRTPEHINQAAIEAINAGDTKYPPVAGTLALRQGVSFFLKQQFGISYEPDQILISTGAKQALYNGFMSLVNPGEEVIIPAPYWVSYVPMVELAEGLPVIVPTSINSGLKLTPNQLEAAITPKTRLLVLNSPSNPSGAVYTPDELRALGAVLERYPSVLVISDEIYAMVKYDVEFLSFAAVSKAMYERTLTITGVSKAFAMTGWRIGFTAGPKWMVDLAEKIQSQSTSGACSIAQAAATKAVTADLTPTLDMVARFKSRRDLGLKLFKTLMPNIPLSKPDGAFYFYPNIAPLLGKKTKDGVVINSADDLVEHLLKDWKVAVIPGNGFGNSDHIRLSYATDEATIEAGLKAMASCFNALK